MKTYLHIFGVTMVAASVLGQGTIDFRNNNATWVKFNDNGTEVPLAAPAFVQLFAAPGGATFTPWNYAMPAAQAAADFLAANPLFKFMGSPVPMSVMPGRFNGGAVTVTNTTPGGPVEAVIVAWQGNFSSFDAAVAGNGILGAGAGKLSFAVTGNPLVPEPAVELTSGASSGSPFKINPPIPEPSSLALISLGAAAMSVRRRVK